MKGERDEKYPKDHGGNRNFSTYSTQTLEFACDLAQDLKGELVIVNVINQRDVEAVRKVANVTSNFPSVEEWIKARETERSNMIRKLLGEISRTGYSLPFFGKKTGESRRLFEGFS